MSRMEPSSVRVAQRLKRLLRVHERWILCLMRQKLGFRQLRADAAASEQIFKIAQLVIDVLVAERLFRRHIGQLAEDHFIRIPERIDAHALFFAGALVPRTRKSA